MARLTVIVPATDRPPTLPECLRALDRAREGPDEIVAVTEPPGAGPAQARNEGARQAGGDLLLFVDADVIVHADALSRLRAAFDADRGLAAVIGSYDDSPSAGVVSGFRNLLHHHVHQSSPGPATTFWAGLGAIRRDAFEAVGGFDHLRYPRSSIEDIELGVRLAASGRRCLLDPSIQGTHLKAWTLRSMVTTDFARRGVPWVRLLLRNRGGDLDRATLNLGPRHRASALAALAAAAAIAARRPALVLGALATLVALNHGFYALLKRRRGSVEAAAGVGLHAVHHLTGAASVPAGAIAHLLETDRTGRASST